MAGAQAASAYNGGGAREGSRWVWFEVLCLNDGKMIWENHGFMIFMLVYMGK